MENFVVACSKPWGEGFFQDFSKKLDGRWRYVSSKEGLITTCKSLQPRYVFFPHWNWKVPDEIVNGFECVCFHMTDLPYGRGGSPLQNLILEGKSSTMLSAIKMVGEMDAGPIYLKQPLSLEGRAENIYEDAARITWDMIRTIVLERPEPTPQIGDVKTFKRRTPEMSELPLCTTAQKIYDFIRMLDAPSYPPAFIDYGDFRIEFSFATINGETVSANAKIKKLTKGQFDE
jgi:methionyl-tRNA formyltransferase